jgi:hypothetical protein
VEFMKYVRAQWDRTGAVLATLLGLVVLLLGYQGTASTEYISEQIPYLISGGLLGIVLLTIGAVLWISADLRDEWREMCEQGEAIRQEQIERRTELKAYLQEEVARQLAAARPTKPLETSRRAASAASNGARSSSPVSR